MASSRSHWVRNMVLYLPKPDSLWLMALSDIFFAVSAFLSSHICRRIGLFKSMYIQKWKVQRGPKLVVSWSSQWFLCTCNPCCIQDLSFNCWCGLWHFLATQFFHSRPHFAFITITVCLICSVKLKPSLIPNVTELWVAETMVNGWNGGQIPTAFRAIPRDLLVLKDKENWTFK